MEDWLLPLKEPGCGYFQIATQAGGSGNPNFQISMARKALISPRLGQEADRRCARSSLGLSGCRLNLSRPRRPKSSPVGLDGLVRRMEAEELTHPLSGRAILGDPNG